MSIDTIRLIVNIVAVCGIVATVVQYLVRKVRSGEKPTLKETLEVLCEEAEKLFGAGKGEDKKAYVLSKVKPKQADTASTLIDEIITNKNKEKGEKIMATYTDIKENAQRFGEELADGNTDNLTVALVSLIADLITEDPNELQVIVANLTDTATEIKQAYLDAKKAKEEEVAVEAAPLSKPHARDTLRDTILNATRGK